MKKAILVLPTLFIALYFFRYAGLGLRADFTHDDLMNMWRSLEQPYAEILADTVVFWRPARTFRPVGGLVYKVFLDLFHLNPLPMRVFIYSALLVNLFLLYMLALRLTGSRLAGALAALLFAYHPGFGNIYFSSGMLYDVFCFTFSFACLWFYVQVRHSGKQLGSLQLLFFLFLLVLALDSKEMALALPILIGLYELLYHPPDLLARRAVAPVLGAAAAAAYYFGRVAGKGGLAQNAAYAPVISLAQYLKQTGLYLDQLFLKNDWFTAWRTAGFLLILVAVAWFVRSDTLKFSVCVFAAGILPVAFIPARSLTAVYIPVAGLALYGATLLALGRERLPKCKPCGIILFALVAVCLIRVLPGADGQFASWQKEYGPIRAMMTQLPRLHPTLPRGTTILVVKDPFGDEYNWASLFITCLVYRDPYVRLDRLQPKLAKYDIRLAYEDGRWRDLPAGEVPVRR